MKKARGRGPRGSVTVVLAMVLVPIMVVTGLFVDGSRGVLARSVVRSAQQVAINDVLANHDEMLRKTFGLLAVIDSENLDVAAQQILESSASADGGGDILRLQFSSEQFGNVEVVANANLAEPQVLTNQIVEYMKYRAPVEFMTSLAESINWLINLQTKIELVKKRVEGINKLAKLVDEAEGLIDEIVALEEQLTAAYDALNKVLALIGDGPDSIEQRFADLAEAYLDRELDDTRATRQAYTDAEARVLEIWTLVQSAATASTTAATSLAAVDPSGVVTAASELIDFVNKDLLPAAEKDATASAGTDSDAEDAEADASLLKTTAQAIKDAITEKFSEADREDIGAALDRFATDSKTILSKKYTKAKLTSMISSAVGDARDAYEAENESEDEDETPSDAAIDSIVKDALDAVMVLVREDLNGPIRELTDAMLFSKLKDFADTYLTDVREAIEDAVKRGLAQEVSDQATVSVQAMLKSMKDRALSYAELVDAVASQRATTYSGSDERWADRPSVGGETDGAAAADQIAAFEGTDDSDLDGFADDSEGLLDSVLNLVDGLLGAVEDVRDGIFFTEYVTGMFTYSTLDNVSVTAAQNTDQNCLWSSACAASKKSAADKKSESEKADPSTRTPESGPASSGDPGKRISQEAYPECWQGPCASEVEYVLTGINSPAAVYGMISLLRYGINLVVAFSDRLVTAIRAVVATFPFVGWLAAAVPFVAALIQTFDDMARMRNGELVTFIPTELTVLRFDSDLTAEALSIGEVDNQYEQSSTKGTSGKRRELGDVELGYIHYLKLFLIIGWMGDREGMVRRAGDVIDFNMGYLGQDEFRLTKAGTAFTLTSGYEVQPFISTFFQGTGPADSLFEGDSGQFHLTTVGGF